MSNPNKQNRNQQPAPTQVAKDQPSEQIAPQKNYLDEPAIAPIVEDLTKGVDAPRPKSDNVAIFEDRLQAYLKACSPNVTKTPLSVGQAQGGFIYTVRSLWNMPVQDFKECISSSMHSFRDNPKIFNEGFLFSHMDQVSNVSYNYRQQHYAVMNVMLNGANPKVVLSEVVDINLATRGLPDNAAEYLTAYYGLQ
jgi:hypothetical protein